MSMNTSALSSVAPTQLAIESLLLHAPAGGLAGVLLLGIGMVQIPDLDGSLRETVGDAINHWPRIE